jgi:hypothetical protein
MDGSTISDDRLGHHRGTLGSRVDWGNSVGSGLRSLASPAHDSGSSKQNGKKELHSDRREEFQMFKNGCK